MTWPAEGDILRARLGRRVVTCEVVAVRPVLEITWRPAMLPVMSYHHQGGWVATCLCDAGYVLEVAVGWTPLDRTRPLWVAEDCG